MLVYYFLYICYRIKDICSFAAVHSHYNNSAHELTQESRIGVAARSALQRAYPAADAVRVAEALRIRAAYLTAGRIGRHVEHVAVRQVAAQKDGVLLINAHGLRDQPCGS